MRYLISLCVMLVLSCSAFAQSPGVSTGAALSPMQFNWVAPTQRENGVALTTAEIGGYELRYKLKSATSYSFVNIPSGSASSYLLNGIGSGDYEYQIAVYDKNGLYSDWVSIVPAVASNPKPVTGATARRQGVDPKAKCVAPSCNVAVKGEYK